MGSFSTKTLDDSRPASVVISDPTSWNLDQVRELHQRYKDENYDFGLDKMVFTELCMETFPEAGDLPEILWKKFVLGDEEIIHTLQVFCGLASVSQGLTSEKISFLFDVFDFNNSSELNYDELFILIFTTLSGIVRMIGTGYIPEERPVEKIVDELYAALGKDISTKVGKSEFQNYNEQNLQLTTTDLSPLDVLKKFDLLEG